MNAPVKVPVQHEPWCGVVAGVWSCRGVHRKPIALKDEIEAFIVSLPAWMIEPEAMAAILALLHA